MSKVSRTRVASRVRDTFDIELPLRSYFESPTVAEMAGVIEDRIIEELEDLDEDEVESQWV